MSNIIDSVDELYEDKKFSMDRIAGKVYMELVLSALEKPRFVKKNYDLGNTTLVFGSTVTNTTEGDNLFYDLEDGLKKLINKIKKQYNITTK